MYKIVTDADKDGMENRINQLMRDGWVPQGGVYYDHHGHGLWIQALVKQEPAYASVNYSHDYEYGEAFRR